MKYVLLLKDTCYIKLKKEKMSNFEDRKLVEDPQPPGPDEMHSTVEEPAVDSAQVNDVWGFIKASIYIEYNHVIYFITYNC